MKYKYLVNIDSNDNLKESDILKFLTTSEHLKISKELVKVQSYIQNPEISNNTFLVESDITYIMNFIPNYICTKCCFSNCKFIVTKLQNSSYYIHFVVHKDLKSSLIKTLKQYLENILKSDKLTIVLFTISFSRIEINYSPNFLFPKSFNSNDYNEVVVKLSYLSSDLSKDQIFRSLFIDSHIPSPFFLEFLDSPTSSSSQLFSAFIPSSIFSSLLNQTISKIEFIDGSFLIPSQLIPYQNKPVVLVPSSYSPFDFFIQNTTIGIMKSWVISISPLPQVGDKVQIFSGGSIISGSVSNQNPIQVELN